jgi:hypothetical protein
MEASEKEPGSRAARMTGLFIIIYISSALCISGVNAQIRKAPPNTTTPEEPALMALTEAERALDFKSIVANQPDFVANELFFYGEGFGGFSAKRRVARKGNRYFVDTGYVKVIMEPGKEIRLNDGNKTFEEIPIGSEFVLGNSHPIDPQILASQKGVSFTALGAQTIDGHKRIKIEAKIPDQTAQVFLYAAEDLKYLVVVAQLLNPPRGAIQRLQNISLAVPGELVDIPPNYRPLPKHKWSLVDPANVSYDGKPGKDYSVFRSDDGNQLFVTLYEPHPNTGFPLPWHYLVFFKEQTVEIGFQGMLITSDTRANSTNIAVAVGGADGATAVERRSGLERDKVKIGTAPSPQMRIK